MYDSLVGDFGPAITLIIVIALAIIALLRFGIRFDLNDYLKTRKERHMRLARISCTHMILKPHENGVEIQSLWYSPPGTLDWICNRCGTVSHVSPSDEEIEKQAEYYIANPNEYSKMNKRFLKHLKKSY